MTVFPDRLEEDGLRLRPLAPSDLDTLVAQLSDWETARWLAAVRHPFTRDDALEILEHAREPAHRVRAIEHQSAMIGCLALQPTLWFWLRPQDRGRGWLGRALRLALPAHFATGGAAPVAVVRDDNLGCLRALRRLGFSELPERTRRHFHSERHGYSCTRLIYNPPA